GGCHPSFGAGPPRWLAGCNRSAVDRDRLRRGPTPRRKRRAAPRRPARRRVTTQAALYVASADDIHGARLRVAGRPVAFRTLLPAVRAGAERVGVPTALRSPDFEAALATSPRARAALVWLDGPEALLSAPTLLLPAAALVPAGALARLLNAGPGAVLAES